ncbi:MAG: CBS domain-containing protein [Candidatus Nanoarchaeia archaeon]|jgi:CBS domain-containing protein
MRILVVDVMTAKIVCAKPIDSVLEAVKKMIKVGIGNVLVVDNGKLKGIITEKDILTKVVALNKKPESFKVSDIMTAKLVTIKPLTDIQEAARLMIDKGIRRIPVVDRGKIIGVITSSDLLRVNPALIGILSERFKYDNPCFDGESIGVCEICNIHDRNLVQVNGRLVCVKCKKKI